MREIDYLQNSTEFSRPAPNEVPRHEPIYPRALASALFVPR
jgi:hypothetical protein